MSMLLVEFNRERMMQFGVSTFRAKEFGVLQPAFLMALGRHHATDGRPTKTPGDM